MKETEDKPVVICPYDGCELEQETNGLIAWCEDAHVYEVDKDDERYSQT